MDRLGPNVGALHVTLLWVQRRWHAKLVIAESYMTLHAAILRWTNALKEIIRSCSRMSSSQFTRLPVQPILTAACELMSATICLPDPIFCPIVLWAARRLAEDVLRYDGRVDSRSVRMCTKIFMDAYAIRSDTPSPASFATLTQATAQKFSPGGVFVTIPTLADAFIDCAIAHTREAQLWSPARAACRSIASFRFHKGEPFEAAEARLSLVTRASPGTPLPQGIAVDVYDMHEGFLESIRISFNEAPCLWILDGMPFVPARHTDGTWRWKGEIATEVNFETDIGVTARPFKGCKSNPLQHPKRKARESKTNHAIAALTVVVAWLRKGLDTMVRCAIDYMDIHRPILRWTTALLLLTELLHSEHIACGIYGRDLCYIDPTELILATNEVISSTLALPAAAFCPTILWLARFLNEDGFRCGGTITRSATSCVLRICDAAMGIFSIGPNSYQRLIGNAIPFGHAHDGRGSSSACATPWPSIRRSYVDCAASLAHYIYSMRCLSAANSAFTAAAVTNLEGFRLAWEGLQRASLHGRLGRYVHGFFIPFRDFAAFSRGEFLNSLALPTIDDHTAMWVMEGMLCHPLSVRPISWTPPAWTDNEPPTTTPTTPQP